MMRKIFVSSVWSITSAKGCTNCQVTQYQTENHLGWTRALRPLSPTVNPALPSPALSHVPKCHILRHKRPLNTNIPYTDAREAEAGAGHPNAMMSPS